MAMNEHISMQSHRGLSVQLQVYMYESVHEMNYIAKFNTTCVESRSMDFLKYVF